MQMPPMVDVTHPEAFPQADANPMHNESGDSIIRLAAEDAKAAIRMVREHADEWHISKEKIGYLGFSAGGGVAIAAMMSADAMERPDFLCTNFGPSLMPVAVPKDAPPLLIMTRAEHLLSGMYIVPDARNTSCFIVTGTILTLSLNWTLCWRRMAA